MPNQQSETMLRELNRKAKEYGEKATLLSNLLEEAEAFLNELPSKMHVSVGEGDNQLTFVRWESSDWRLWYGDDQEGSLVTDAPVELKAKAARMLPQLVDVLFASVSERLSVVNEGLDALKQVPFLRFGKEDE